MYIVGVRFFHHQVWVVDSRIRQWQSINLRQFEIAKLEVLAQVLHRSQSRNRHIVSLGWTPNF